MRLSKPPATGVFFFAGACDLVYRRVDKRDRQEDSERRGVDLTPQPACRLRAPCGARDCRQTDPRAPLSAPRDYLIALRIKPLRSRRRLASMRLPAAAGKRTRAEGGGTSSRVVTVKSDAVRNPACPLATRPISSKVTDWKFAS